ncbi:9743_t:CDS:2 [Rhizophagus irregularis]|nr:9743_t:CDS:2 [Rhizophagus irregularis]
MSYYKLPPNYYLQFYPPPPHPPPPPAFQTTTQKFLRFHDFHHTHFIQNRNFFHALNSTTPWWSWKVEEEGVEEGSRYQQQQPEEYENYEYQEEYYEEREEEKAEGVEFVLSEEAIAMFRFSELRKQQPSSTDDNYLDTEPDPSIIPSFHNQPCVESKELYGDSCTIINTLEAAVNSTFVQSFNVSNKATNNSRRDEEVVYWPVLPLRFV